MRTRWRDLRVHVPTGAQVLVLAILGISLLLGELCTAQTPVQQTGGAGIAGGPENTPNQPDSSLPSFTFKAVVRLVILDVIVRDREDNPVRNLTERDFQVSERVGQSSDVPQKISFFSTVNQPADQSARTEGIVLVTPLRPSFCDFGGIYELSYYLSPESRRDGVHRISVTSPRRDARLSFRHAYKIEADAPVAMKPGEAGDQEAITRLRNVELAKEEARRSPGLALAVIACYDTLDTTSLPLRVQKLKSHQGKEDYEFIIPGDVLTRHRPDQTHKMHIEFALCTFATDGHPLLHFESQVEQTLSGSGYQSVIANGIHHNIEFAPGEAASGRLVVRDAETGALGSTELQFIESPVSELHIRNARLVSSFGTTVPVSSALCGDVYKLAPWTSNLPRFSSMEPIAAIYTTSLGIYSRFFTEGIPGVTSRTEWFGINYQGIIGIHEPGEYQFELKSDDGAKLYVDGEPLISTDGTHPWTSATAKVHLAAGEHSIRVAYFQGPRVEVALVLLVKPPGKGWRLFDTRDFPAPQDSSPQGEKLPVPK